MATTTTFSLPINQHGQITLPKNVRKFFGVKSGEDRISLTLTKKKTATIEKEKTRDEQIEEMLQNLDKLREKAYRRNPAMKEKIKHVAGKSARELREEFDNSLEGEAYYYRYSPAYYYEQHPEEPRTPEIQAAIDKHNKLLDYLAAANPENADRLEEYRANKM